MTSGDTLDIYSNITRCLALTWMLAGVEADVVAGSAPHVEIAAIVISRQSTRGVHSRLIVHPLKTRKIHAFVICFLFQHIG